MKNLIFIFIFINKICISQISSLAGIIASSGGLYATGGAITISGGYATHVFATTDVFTINKTTTIQYLVVGGGGAGGMPYGGGGGGGDVQTGTLTITPGTYTVTVGQGGIPDSNAIGNNGGTSIFSSITSIGGGGGGRYNGTAGVSGANGGGGGAASITGGSGGTGTAGFNGGTGQAGSNFIGGGGGGDSTAGVNGASGGTGGKGKACSITGTLRYYGGGGGGGALTSSGGTGGLGGGGNGGLGIISIGTKNGLDRTGGGGGGSGDTHYAGAGGSGIVIIKYATSNPNTSIAFLNGFLFNASSKYFASSAANLLNTEISGSGQKMSFSLWIKRETMNYTTWQTIFSRDTSGIGRQFAIEFLPGERLGFYAFTSTTAYTLWATKRMYTDTTNWCQMVITFDNTLSLANKVKIYLNGILISTSVASTGAGLSSVKSSPTNNLYIAVTNYGGLINPYQGYLSKITYYTDILTASDVAILFNHGFSTNELTATTSIAPFMNWEASNYTGTFTWNDNSSTSYGVSKSYISTGMTGADYKSPVSISGFR